MEQPFRGLGVALVTPFRNGEVDFEALERVIEHVIDGGADFLVSLGTTGEATTLSPDEAGQVIRHTVEINRGRLPLVAGLFGGSNTRSIQQRLRTFDLSGVNAVMSASPAYNKPNQEGIYQHYMALAEASPLPIIIYNVPGRTASNVEAATTLRLAKAERKFIAVKEASADMVQAMTIMRDKPEHFLLLSGDDPTAFPLIATGGDGLISVIGNAFPHAYSRMVQAALQGRRSEARKWNDLFIDFHPWLYIDGNPAGIKFTLSELGLCSPELRLPLTPMHPFHAEALKKLLTDIRERMPQ